MRPWAMTRDYTVHAAGRSTAPARDARRRSEYSAEERLEQSAIRRLSARCGTLGYEWPAYARDPDLGNLGVYGSADLHLQSLKQSR
jgi:hypothetical protein